jgi:hypothetical protein
VRDAFAIVEQIVEQATHDNRTTQPKMVGERVAQGMGYPYRVRFWGLYKHLMEITMRLNW